MKFSSMLLFGFSFLLIFGCKQKSKRLLVRPLEKEKKDSLYSKIFPFETYPELHFRKNWDKEHLSKHIPDTLFTNRIRVKKSRIIPFDMEANFPAVPLDIILPDSVRLGDGFYFLVVLKAREGALFSKLWIENKSNRKFKVRAFQQQVYGLPSPCSQYEEVLQSFYPLEKGGFTFDFYYYDSLLLTRKMVVF